MSLETEVKAAPAHPQACNRLAAFYRTTVGKKVVMAVSGLVLLVFVVTHLLGNLQVFFGAKKLNHYAVLLRGMPELLWAAAREPVRNV